MRPPLTRMQRRIVDYITAHVETFGWPPTVREIADAAGLASTSSAAHQIRQLEYKGYVVRDYRKPRAIRVLP